MWGVFDLQRQELREETYKSKKQAIHEFADYWRGIAFSDWLDSFDFEDYKKQKGLQSDYQFSKNEENAIIENDLQSMTDIEIFDFFEFEAVDLKQ